MTKQIALITGANKGIGFETAKQLGKQGITVLIGSRDRIRGETAAKELATMEIDATFVPLDVTSPKSISEAVNFVEKKFQRLDILINNAGILDYENDTIPSETTLETFRTVFETNFFGLVETTKAFLPLLKKSTAGRIVNLSSILGSMAEHQDPNSPIYGKIFSAYNISKSAVNSFTVQLAEELKNTTIKVNAAHPGWVKTDMGGEQAPMEIVDGAKTSVWLATIPADGPTGGYFHGQERMRW